MPYKFNEYVSTYIDPQSIKISEALQQRYKENLAASDQLYMALDQMKAALPFEKDLERKKELQAEIDRNLNMLADRGDYENLGFAVHKTAKDFSKKYAPIKENYERYSAAMTDLQEAVKKGDVNQEYAKLFPLYMVKDYSGFEVDPETGRVKEGTMFSAPSYVKDPKLMDKIKDALQILKPEKFTNEIESLSAGDGSLWVTTKNGVEEIKLEDVQDVIDSVFAEPDVKAYMEQFSDMKTYAATKDAGAAATLTTMSANYTSAMSEINKLLEDRNLNSQQKQAYKNQLQILGEEINKINEAVKDEGSSYEFIKDKFKKEIRQPYQTYGEKAAIRSEEHSVKKRFSEKYLKDREWELANQTLEVQGQVTLADRNGATYEEKNNLARELYGTAWKLEQDLKKQEGQLSEDSENRLKAEIKAARDQADLIRQQMVTAANSAITEKDIIESSPDAWKTYNVMKELYPYAKPGEIYVKIQETFDNTGDQDYIDFQNKFKQKYGAEYTTSGTTYDTKGIGFIGTTGPSTAFTTSELGTRPSFEAAGLSMNIANVLSRKFTDKIDSQFSEIKTSASFAYGAIPAPTTEQSIKLTEAMKNFFINKPITADFTVADITKEGVTTVSGKDLAGFKVVDVGWNQENNIYELKLMGGTNDAPVSKTVHLDGKYIRNSTLDVMINSPSNRMAKVINDMDLRKSGEISTRKVKINMPDKEVLDAWMIVESDGAGNPYIRFVDNNWQDFLDEDKKRTSLSQKHKKDSEVFIGLVNAGFRNNKQFIEF